MSELNYINETVVPRMPKSVSDEQLFVFVPVGNDTVAGIFKINRRDFDVASLPVLTINQDDTVIEEGIGFVRSGAVYTFVKSEVGYLNNIKQNKKLSEPIAGETTVEGALTNLAGRMNTAEGNVTDLKGRMFTAEGDINTLKTTVGNAVTTAAEAKDAATRAENDVNELSKKVTNINNQVDANTGKITQLRTDVDGLSTRVDTAEEDIGNLTTKDGELTTRVTNLEQSAYGGETPIGAYPSSATLPTSEQLTAFVQQEVSRAPKLGDVVLFTQIVTGGTDKSYKFMYTATGWSNYVIPTVESATNTDKGILQGTLGDTTGNVQVSIVGGKVADILVKDGSTYKSIKVLLDTLRAALVKTFNNVEFTLVATDDNTITNFPCKYTADIGGVNVGNVADVYFSATQIPLEIFSSYAEVSANKVSIFATTATNYPTSVTVPTVKIS